MYRQAIFLQMSVLVFAMVCNGAHLICKNQIVGRNFRIGAHLISSTWFLMPIARNDVLRKNYYIHRMILTMSKCPRKHQRSLDQRRRVPQWRSVTQTEAACLVFTLVLLSLLSSNVRRPTPLKPKYPQYDTKKRYFRKSAEYLIPGRTLKIKSSFSAALRFWSMFLLWFDQFYFRSKNDGWYGVGWRHRRVMSSSWCHRDLLLLRVAPFPTLGMLGMGIICDTPT